MYAVAPYATPVLNEMFPLRSMKSFLESFRSAIAIKKH